MMNRDSNSYTVIYAAVMVILVAVMLAFTSESLKTRQNDNEAIDKMQQILVAINQEQPNKNLVKETYRKFIKEELLVNENGEVVKKFENDQIGNSEAFKMSTAKAFKEILSGEKIDLPLYVAEINGQKKIVLPMNGTGLWGPIWGYISVDADGSTIYGAGFGNAGETPGLGAEISKPAFGNEFKGKHLFVNGEFKSIAVVKHGSQVSGQDYVDGISGGTLTSKGVNAMLRDALSPYQSFLKKNANSK